MENTIAHTPPVAGLVQLIERDGVFIIVLGAAEERVITITKERMESLREALSLIKTKPAKGLVITGPKESMFAAGADINAITSISAAEEGKQIGLLGQSVFQMIEDLNIITVAAISGPCMGGGCELALACKVRLISDDSSSQIGLPETKLGIIPGWGGTQRLPRLIGLRSALSIILPGKALRPKQALEVGLVNEVVATDRLITRAEKIAKGESYKKKSIGIFDRFLTFTSFGRAIVRKTAEDDIKKQTKGQYPAPPAALEAIMVGLNQGTKEGYPYEAAELGRLLVTPESKSLVNLFFLSEGSKKIGRSGKEAITGLSTCVIGAGVMGAGIAGAFLEKGFSVVLKDTNREALDRGISQAKSQIDKKKYLSQPEKDQIIKKLKGTTTDLERPDQIGLVVEAIVENMDVKKSVLSQIATRLSPQAIVATNTSSLSVTELSEAIVEPSRVIGMHFFNPVDKMPLIEIIRGKNTSDRAVSIVAALATKLGKFPVVVEDVPGFLVNRIFTPYLNEAAHLMLEGYSVQAIDKAATSFGLPMGPLRLLDEVGLDVAMHVSEVMCNGYGERMQGPVLVSRLAAQKLLGKKSNAGFYRYQGSSDTVNDEVFKILDIKPKEGVINHQLITDRLVLSLFNEAIRCLDEGVAGIPSKEAADQIDLATVMGMGFPPFRGGLIKYGQTVGAANILKTLKSLEQQFGSRFSPFSGIVQRSEEGLSFYESCKKH